MVLILLVLAQAGAVEPTKPVLEAGVSAGWSYPIGASEFVAEGALRRADLGIGLGAFHIGGAASWSIHDVSSDAWWSGGPITADFQLSRYGLSARWSPTFGRFVPGVRAEAAAITFLSPYDETAYAEDVLPYTGNNDLGITSTGLLVGGGLDAGLAIIPDHAWVSVSLDVGFDTLPALGLEVGVRGGLSAAL